MICENKVAIVTGAAGKGMGRSIALTLAREGAKVAVNYRSSKQSAEAIVNHIAKSGRNAIAIQADVFEADACKKLVDVTRKEFGQVDICIIGPGGGWHPEPIDKLNPTTALEDTHQELVPIYNLMPLLLPEMYKREWGRLIGIALIPPYTSPAYSYNIGKAARAHALLLARDQAWKNGVTINIIGPGPVSNIETLEEAIEQCNHGPAWKKRSTTSPQDIAESVVFMCSDAGRFITGCVVPYLFNK